MIFKRKVAFLSALRTKARLLLLGPILFVSLFLAGNYWRGKSAGAQTAGYIGGYVFPVSAKWGEKVDFHLSTNASRVKIEIFRQGVVQEKVAVVDEVKGTYFPCHHSEVGCFFPKVYSLTLDSRFRPGLYLAKFINKDAPLEEDLAYFVVKPDQPGSLSKIAVVLPLNTWEVHNFRDGRKVYPSPYEPGYEDRARTASFLRPWADICSNLELGYPIGGPAYIWWLESQGYFPEYLTDIDLDKNPAILSNYRVGISLAHHEYWSWRMRDAVENYLNNGGNFLFLSGNVSWWQVRYDDDYSLIRVYKLKEEDPYYLDSDKNNDRQVTVNWYDDPVYRPETLMSGTGWFYGGFWEPGPQSYDPDPLHPPGFKVYRTADPEWSWVFKDTGLKDGDRIGTAMFQSMVENDGTIFTLNSQGLPVPAETEKTKTPGNFTILGISNPTRSGSRYGHSVMGIRKTASGGIVFTGSQEYFSAGLTSRDPAIEKIILNLLAKLAPGELKEKVSLPYTAGGLKVIEFEPSLSSSAFDFQLESAACSLNSGHDSYWVWVLPENISDSGSFYYSLGSESGWFNLKSSTSNPWSVLTDSATGFAREFHLQKERTYRFSFSPRTATTGIKKILLTNTQYFYPSRFGFAANNQTVINLPSWTENAVQPVLVNLNPAADSYMESWNPTTNYGSQTYLRVKNDNVDKSLLNFDLNFLSGAKINRAFLKLYLLQNTNNVLVNVGAASLSKNWLEKEVNWQQAKSGLLWSTPGAAGAADYQSGSINLFNQQKIQAIGQWYYFEVTNQIKSFLENPAGFQGFLLLPVGQNSASTVLSFASREYPTAAYRPVLEINYLPNSAPVSPSLTPTPTVFFSPTPTLGPTLTPTPTPVLASPTPTATATPTTAPGTGECLPESTSGRLYFQDGSTLISPPLVWEADFGQNFSLSKAGRLEEIKIKVKNYGGGQKTAGVAITTSANKKLENNLPSPLVWQGTITIPCCYYEGWVSVNLSQNNIVLNSLTDYFVWLKDNSGYHAIAWSKGSLEIRGWNCSGDELLPTATPTIAPTPTATPTPLSSGCLPSSTLEKAAAYEIGKNPNTLPDVWETGFRRIIKPSFSGRGGQIKLSLHNWGNGGKTINYAITESNAEIVNGNLTAVVATGSLFLSGGYDGWVEVNLPTETLLEAREYLLWVKGQNTYRGTAWNCNTNPSSSGLFQLYLYRCQ